MPYTPNPTWQDAPSTATPATAATWNHLEAGIETFAAIADTANTTLTALAPKLLGGSGSPNGAVTAPVGTLYLQQNGILTATLWIKEAGSGNTNWTAL